ncbi:dTDP-4-dehydrorhamnose reductase family protein [Rhizobium sp. RAF36]|uniref:dTDP-4-dehydrorhamnose reductase family protein n=1 Tax=Rhizobium sp. RAF36 TaxID=3233055 RepID=UPI000DD622DE
MRILILGGDGMLGHQLLLSLRDRHTVKVTVRLALSQYEAYGLFNESNTFDQLDLRESAALRDVISAFSPDLVINAAGIVKQRDAASEALVSLEINSVLPHRLAEYCRAAGAYLIHFSTDCIFKGDRGGYSEADNPDATDLYGRTKLLGEVSAENCITLRTSIIGLELHRKTSLVEWFLSQTGEIKGYTRAIFTGITTAEAARLVDFLTSRLGTLSGIYNVASKPISKHDLLLSLSEKMCRTDVRIVPDSSFHCDRSLLNDLLTEKSGYSPPSWDVMLEELAGLIGDRQAPNAASA